MNSCSKISIIMPVYKVEKYLARAIESVISQSFSDWELILVDDGSPDRCGEICESYAQRDVRIQVIHQANGGLSVARNVGMKYCNGEYLMFIDSDDYIAQSTLEIMWQKAHTENFDIVMAGHMRVEPDGRILDQSADWQESTDIYQIRKRILLNILPNFACGKLYKKYLWENVQFPKGQLMEDMSTVVKVFYKAKSACVCKIPLYYYSRENDESIMNNPELKNYIRVRYGKFIGWQEHERLAVNFDSDCIQTCARFAMKAAVRAYSLDTEQNVLSDEERKCILNYMKGHRELNVPLGIRLMERLILGKNETCIKILGQLQQILVKYQMQRRQRK